MTDRELLELAAKAAGYQIHIGQLYNGMESLFIGKPKQVMEDPDPIEWNPLTDDGDALRLSVKLSIHIEHAGQSGKKADRVQASPRGHGHLAWVEMYEGNPHAATRRAIVRAAAEIGKVI